MIKSQQNPFKKEKENLVSSKRVKLFDLQRKWRLELKWFSGKDFEILALGLFATAAWYIGLCWESPRVYTPLSWPPDPWIIPSLITAGFTLGYFIRNFLNKTVIQVTADGLRFWTTPFSRRRPQTIPLRAIQQIGLRQKEVFGIEGTRRVDYLVRIYLQDGSEIPLFKAHDLNEALSIEQLLEKKMGIEDNQEFDRSIRVKVK